MKSLNETLAYENGHVVDRLVTLYGLPRPEAEDLFVEAKRWLWLCAQHSRDLHDGRPETPAQLSITTSLVMVDEAWHAFILFTRDYMLFCRDYLGKFIHHQPTPESEIQLDPDDYRELMRATMSYVYDRLGPETLKKWYGEYHDAYSALEIRFTPTTLECSSEQQPPGRAQHGSDDHVPC